MATEIYKGFEGKIYLGETTTTDIGGIPADSGLDLDSPAAANLVGRIETCTVRMENGIEAYYGCGDRDPTDIKEGLRKVSGTLNRAMLNGVLFAAALGQASTDGSSASTITSKTLDNLSEFKLQMRLAQATNYVSIIVEKVKFDTYEFSVPNTGETIMENMDWIGKFSSAKYLGKPASGI